jgi:hypothetical protein
MNWPASLARETAEQPERDMESAREPKRYLDEPENVSRLWRRFVMVCAAVAAVDVLGLVGILYHRHASLFVEGLPGFYAGWGFVGIVVLIVSAKELRRLVMRPEDYYERRDDAD